MNISPLHAQQLLPLAGPAAAHEARGNQRVAANVRTVTAEIIEPNGVAYSHQHSGHNARKGKNSATLFEAQRLAQETDTTRRSPHLDQGSEAHFAYSIHQNGIGTIVNSDTTPGGFPRAEANSQMSTLDIAI